jgi:hypothetical protein
MAGGGGRERGRSDPERDGRHRAAPRRDRLRLGIVGLGAAAGAVAMLIAAARVHTAEYTATMTLPTEFGVPEEREVQCDEGTAVDRSRHPQAHDACADEYSSREAVAGVFAAGGGIAAVIAIGATGAAAARLRRPDADDGDPVRPPGW